MDAIERQARKLLDAEMGGDPRETYYAAVAVIRRLLLPPSGWKLVPIEPTWDMRNEGREFLIDGIEKEPERLAYFLWKTMVNEAPVPDFAHVARVEARSAVEPPEGWVLMPVETTGSMLERAFLAYPGFAGEDQIDAVYAALLAARPKVQP